MARGVAPIESVSYRLPGWCTAMRFPTASCRTCCNRPSPSGQGDGFKEIETNYAAADRVLGRHVKVAPSSKVVGDLTLVDACVSADEFARRSSASRHP